MEAVFRALADPTRRSLLDELFLVATRRRGREKLHFLKPVPIRLVHDRWVSKYAEHWAAALNELKTRLETTVQHVFEIYIRTTQERLWEAVTDSEIRSKFQFGSKMNPDWAAGSSFQITIPNAPGLLGEGENPEIDPPHRLVQTMVAFLMEQ